VPDDGDISLQKGIAKRGISPVTCSTREVRGGEEARGGERNGAVGGVISVKIAKLRRHCAVIARSELSRRFLTFMTARDLRFIYAADSSL